MKTDVLISGGGPGGTAAAMFLGTEGVKSIILEQEKFSRFHITESVTDAGFPGRNDRRLDSNAAIAEKQIARAPRKAGASA